MTNATLERKNTAPIEVRGGDGRTLVVRALTYGTIDSYGTVFAFDEALGRGCLTASIEGRSIPLCWAHEHGNVIGRMEAVESDTAKGGLVLRFRLDDPAIVQQAAVAVEQVASGSVRGISVGFDASHVEMRKWEGGEYPTFIDGCTLLECSLVIVPAVDGATVLEQRHPERARLTYGRDAARQELGAIEDAFVGVLRDCIEAGDDDDMVLRSVLNVYHEQVRAIEGLTGTTSEVVTLSKVEAMRADAAEERAARRARPSVAPPDWHDDAELTDSAAKWVG